MKQILSMNYAMIDDEILSHPSTIYTDEDVEVVTFDTEEQLVTYIAGMETGMFPELPEVGEWVEAGIYKYGTDKVKCITAHTRMHYTIKEQPALFLIIPTVVDYPVWKQPTGAHDAYQKGDRVHFPAADSSVYESLIDANTWSPTGYPAGWLLIA